jgi:hypothetical protein
VLLIDVHRGGKVAMAFALNTQLPTDLLANLIIVDIAPAKGALSSEFRQYTAIMSEIEKAKVRSRKEADEMLQTVEPVLLSALLLRFH